MPEAPVAPPAGIRLVFPEVAPPVAAIAVAELGKVEIGLQADPKLAKDGSPELLLAHKQHLQGRSAIIRYLGRAARTSKLAGATPVATVEVDHWIDFSAGLTSGTNLEAACAAVDHYLSLRTYLAGHELTAADIACWAQLSATLQWDGLRKSGRLPHLARWFDFVNALPELSALSEKYFPRRRAPPARAGKDGAGRKQPGVSDASFDIGLGPEWRGKVVTRFPPEPSGFLHIGHAKALVLNQEIARANGGRMLMRFDDTNPDKEKDVFVDSIVEDVRRLGAPADRITHTSDYFEQLLDLAVRLIRAGHLYADDTPQEVMKQERLAKQASRRRGREAGESLAVWAEMVAGSPEGFRNCLRFRIDPGNNNGALRDPVAYRCNATPHLRTGSTYKVYPTYDCACPFVDALEGVTHALRTSEYRDREEQFQRILAMQREVWPGLGPVAVWDYSRLSFVHTVLSKRKLTRLVAAGAVDGWDDPRMPTLQGLLRRGATVPALREFILAQGASKNVTTQEWDKIWAINKRHIDPVCPRHAAVRTADRVLLRLTDVPRRDHVTVARHSKHPPAGVKVTERGPAIWLDQEDAALLAEGEEVTLMEWGNAVVRVVRRDAAGKVTSMEGATNLGGSVSSTKWKLTWLADSPDLTPLSLVDFDHLISKKKLEEEDELEDHVTLCSRWETEAVGDANLRTLRKGDIVQLMRKGYFVVDLPYVRPGKPMVLLAIPDGKPRAPVKPESAVRQAAAAREAARAAAAAAAKNAASAAALKPRGNPAAHGAGDANGAAAGKQPGKGASGRRKLPVEAEEAPVTSKIAVPASDIAIVRGAGSTGDGIEARQSGHDSAAGAASRAETSAASQPIPVPNRLLPDGGNSREGIPPTPANTPQTSVPVPGPKLRELDAAVAHMRQPAWPDSASRERSDTTLTPHNTPEPSAAFPRKLQKHRDQQ